MNFRRLFLRILAVVTLAVPPGAALADVGFSSPPTVSERLARLPADNPYVPLLLRMDGLSPEERDSLAEWSREAERSRVMPPGDDHRVLMQSVADEFLRMPSLKLCQAHWRMAQGVSSSEPAGAPPFSPIRQISQLVALAIREQSPADSAKLGFKLTEFGRGFRAVPGGLVDQMIGTVVEDQANKAVAARLFDYSAAELRGLLADYASLPPALDGPSAFSEEWAMDVASLRRDFLPLFERLFHETAQAKEKRDTFTGNLRLSGLLILEEDDEERVWVTFEAKDTKTNFRLREGESHGGFTLVSIEVERKQALLRHAEGYALLDLDALTVHERSPAFQALLATMEKLNAFGDDFDALAYVTDVKARLLANPRGAEGYLADLLAARQEAFAHALQSARVTRWKDQVPWPGLVGGDRLVAFVYPAYSKIARSSLEKSVEAQLLKVAIGLRLDMIERRPLDIALDPWSGESRQPFGYEPNANGGFILRSAFETQSGVGVSFQFGDGSRSAK